MAKLVFAFFCLIAIHTSFALKCKRCENEDCKTLVDETCTPAPTGSKAVCLTEVATLDKKEIVHKKCVVQADNKKYECISIPGQTTVSCVTCDKDLCNSTPKFAVASMGALLLVLVVLRLF